MSRFPKRFKLLGELGIIGTTCFGEFHFRWQANVAKFLTKWTITPEASNLRIEYV